MVNALPSPTLVQAPLPPASHEVDEQGRHAPEREEQELHDGTNGEDDRQEFLDAAGRHLGGVVQSGTSTATASDPKPCEIPVLGAPTL